MIDESLIAFSASRIQKDINVIQIELSDVRAAADEVMRAKVKT